MVYKYIGVGFCVVRSTVVGNAKASDCGTGNKWLSLFVYARYHKKQTMSKILSVVKLLRPEQWVKNVFVFIPLFFDGKMLEAGHLLPVCVAFAAFCLMASSIYCLNDILDVERDRRHPGKCNRPIASGAVSRKQGVALMATCALLALVVPIAFQFVASLEIILMAYFAMNVAYSLKLKRYPIVDVFIIAVGFVMRIFAGGVSSDIQLTPWVVLMTFLLALFLAFAKRRDDVVIYEDTGVVTRVGIDSYNLPFMNQTIGLLAAIIVICYIMYTVSDTTMSRFHSKYLYLTVVWVLAAVIKYLQITIVDIRSGNPTKVLLKNRFVQLCILCWCLHFMLIIYL